MKFATATNKSRRTSAFTLVEVLAALLFMAIVIPVAVDAMHVASLAGEVAARKAVATRIADRILNENAAAANWGQSAPDGTVIENGHEFHWTLRTESWPTDSTLQLLTAEVSFSAGTKSCSVQLSTLANSTPTAGTTMTGMP